MSIAIQYVKIPVSESLSTYTEDKLERLRKKYDWITQIQVYFKIGQDTSGVNKICEMEVSLPGPRIFASSVEKNFEMAVKETISDLNKQLKKRKSVFTQH